VGSSRLRFRFTYVGVDRHISTLPDAHDTLANASAGDEINLLLAVDDWQLTNRGGNRQSRPQLKNIVLPGKGTKSEGFSRNVFIRTANHPSDYLAISSTQRSN